MSQRSALNLSPDGRISTCPLAVILTGPRVGWWRWTRCLPSLPRRSQVRRIPPTRPPMGECGPQPGRRSIPTALFIETLGNSKTANQTTQGIGHNGSAVGPGIPADAHWDLHPFQLLSEEYVRHRSRWWWADRAARLGFSQYQHTASSRFRGQAGQRLFARSRSHAGFAHSPPGLCRSQQPRKLRQRSVSASPRRPASVQRRSRPVDIFGPYRKPIQILSMPRAAPHPPIFRRRMTNYLFVTGSTKANVSSQTTVPPCVVRLKVAPHLESPPTSPSTRCKIPLPCLRQARR